MIGQYGKEQGALLHARGMCEIYVTVHEHLHVHVLHMYPCLD